MSLHRPRIHIWCPGLRQQGGGIEAYTLAFVDAVASWNRDAEIVVCAKNERNSTVAVENSLGYRHVAFADVPVKFRTGVFSAGIVVRAFVEKPELIIVTHLNFSPVAAFLKRALGIPFWVSLHGIEAWDLRHAGRCRALKSADLLLPVSEFTRDRVLNEQGIGPERFAVLHNTVNEKRFTIGARPDQLALRYGIKREDSVILTVGRLAAAEAYKGQDRIIRALPEVRRHIAGVKYLVVGDGDDQGRLKTLASEMNVSDCVIFAGRIADGEIVEHFRLCDLFAMPSTGEGFGISYLEAMACGKPALGGNKDAAVDALRGGELGALVDPLSEREIGETIVSILTKSFVHPLMFSPHLLRSRVIECFGLRVFNQSVAKQCSGFLCRKEAIPTAVVS